MKKVEVERERRIFDDVFKIEEAYLRHERFDGQMSKTIRQLVFERGDSVAAILMNIESDRVILINQFRYPAYKKGPGWIIEAIAGKTEDNETPDVAIRREILEEAGYRVSQLSPISTFYVSPGGTSERIMLFYAEVNNADKVMVGGGLATEHEDIQLVEMSLAEVGFALESGKIIDAKTIIGLQWLQNKIKRFG